MGNKLYVGNLPYSFRDEDLLNAFSAHGTVSSAKVMMERDTGRSKGFGFVEMGSDAEAQAAISAMNGQQYGGRGLVVNEARPMEPRPPRSGGGFGGGGGGGYGGGGGLAAAVVAATAVVTAAAVAAAAVVAAAAAAVTAVAAAATKQPPAWSR
jgi:cold-inducible RNA-binding protein